MMAATAAATCPRLQHRARATAEGPLILWLSSRPPSGHGRPAHDQMGTAADRFDRTIRS
jgi:hypothetical protein